MLFRSDAIMADAELTERQKQMLIDIYESFKKEVRAEAVAGASEDDAAASEDDVHDIAHAKVEAIADEEPDVKTDPEVEAEAETAAEAEVGAWTDLDPSEQSRR